ncbi:hypothetical protein HHK36_018605 [Tetracentron sinense]|uniref:non-specific serine/threonine protein kinase n=1 Tax=Tetracentron sinense TaxID=13715 RepID=A0A834Z2I6_TETSI|nr:hypothetical protein HHK36_018605 [Tetracentron sinense]
MATASFFVFWSSLFVNFLQSQTNDFIFNGFNRAPNMTFNGASIVTRSGALRLTTSSANLIGRAFYTSPISLFNTQSRTPKPSSFSTTFVFAIVKPYEGSGGGGHGLVFTLSPSKEPRRSWFAQYFGLLDPTNNGNSSNHVFAIEFDTVYDMALFGDINDNHVGIDVNSFRSIASAQASYSLNGTTKKEMRLESGLPIQAWIDYNGDNEVVNVTISPLSVPKPSQPLLSHKINLSHVLEESMYVGFSSSTGKLASSHYILGWSFSMNGVAPPLNLRRLPSFPVSQSGSSGLGKKAITIGAVSSAVTLLLPAIVISTFSFQSSNEQILFAMATNNTSVSSNPQSSTPLIAVNAAAQLPHKLTPTNFLAWRCQFESLLIGYDLMGYLDGTLSCPSLSGASTADHAAVKAAYSHWIRQDKLLLNAILAGVSEGVVSHIATTETSMEAWKTLTRLYASLKNIADELALIDAPVTNDDLTLYILNGLGLEYREIVAPIRTRATSLTFEELHDLLLGHERYLKRLEHASNPPVIIANISQRRYNNRFSQKNDKKLAYSRFGNSGGSFQSKPTDNSSVDSAQRGRQPGKSCDHELKHDKHQEGLC